MNPVDYLQANPKQESGIVFALVIVVLILAALVIYPVVMVSKDGMTGGGSEPLRGLYGVSSSNLESTHFSQPGQGFRENFTGGYKTNGPSFYESQALNDNVYEDGLNATSADRYFTANPEWAAFEDKIFKSLDSVQVRTRYHNTTTGERINILKMRAQQLGVPLPVSPPPVSEGMLGSRNKVSGMSDGKLVPNY
jgi:hypothetical protein